MNHRVDLPPKRRLERVLYALAALILAALVLDGIFGPHGFVASYRLRLQVRQVQQKIRRLNRENQEFAGQAQQLKSNPAAVERVARQQMGLVKPGEMVFKVPAKPSTGANASPDGKSGAATSSRTTTPAR